MNEVKKIKTNVKERYVRKNGSIGFRTINADPSKTDTQYSQECDANYILDRFKKTGQLSHTAKVRGAYGDVSDLPDLHTALTQITEANNAFMSLDAKLRRKFNNSPEEMIEWLKDSSNDDEAIKLGLKVKKPSKSPDLKVPNASGGKNDEPNKSFGKGTKTEPNKDDN